MTRKTAADYLADAYQGDVPGSKIADAIREGKGGVVSIDIAKAAILLAIDAEAAAMRERAAGACEANKYGDIAHDHETRMCDDVCDECATAIRALSATGEVGRA